MYHNTPSIRFTGTHGNAININFLLETSNLLLYF